MRDHETSSDESDESQSESEESYSEPTIESPPPQKQKVNKNNVIIKKEV